MRIDKSPAAVLDFVTSSDNAKEGFVVQKSPGVVLTNGHAVDNIKGDGIRIKDCQGAEVADNFVWANGRSGIRIDKSPDLSVDDNSTAENAKYGIWLRKSPPLTELDLLNDGNIEGTNGIAPFRVDP